MKPLRIFGALLFAVDIIALGCSQGGTTSSSTGSGGAHCTNVLIVTAPACNTCLLKDCCANVAACGAVDYCAACFSGIGAPNGQCDSAQVQAQIGELQQCAHSHCLASCYPGEFCGDGGNTYDGGCVDTTPDGGVTSAECQGAHAVLRGTIDGKPFDKSYATGDTYIDQMFMPARLDLSLSGILFELHWQDVCLYPDGPPVPLTGTLHLSGESADRPLQSCSLLWKTHDQAINQDIYRLNLLFPNGDHLTGCTQ